MKALTDTASTISLCNTGTWRLIFRAFKRLFSVRTLQKRWHLISTGTCMFDKTHLSNVQNYLLSVIPSFIHLFIQSVIYLSLFIYLFIRLFLYLSIHLFHACLYNINSWTHKQATAIIIIIIITNIYIDYIVL